VPVSQKVTGITGVFEQDIRKKHKPEINLSILKWKSTGKFSPKTHNLSSSKVIYFM